jgi:hypothetical protein
MMLSKRDDVDQPLFYLRIGSVWTSAIEQEAVSNDGCARMYSTQRFNSVSAPGASKRRSIRASDILFSSGSTFDIGPHHFTERITRQLRDDLDALGPLEDCEPSRLKQLLYAL